MRLVRLRRQVLQVNEVKPRAESIAGTSQGRMTPLWPGERATPGVLYTGANPSDAKLDYAMNGSATADALWYNNYPIAVVPPGWLFGYSNSSGGVAMFVSWMVQHALIQDFYEGPELIIQL